MRLLLVIGICLSLLSCKDEAQVTKLETQGQKEAPLITKSDISKINYTEFILDSKVGKSLDGWEKYYELDNIIINLKNADLSYFKDNNEIVLALIKDLKETVPEQVDTPLITARLVTLETKMLKLESIVNLSNPSKNNILLGIQEFLMAYSNLNLQINKKFEKESQNIQKPY